MEGGGVYLVLARHAVDEEFGVCLFGLEYSVGKEFE